MAWCCWPIICCRPSLGRWDSRIALQRSDRSTPMLSVPPVMEIERQEDRRLADQRRAVGGERAANDGADL